MNMVMNMIISMIIIINGIDSPLRSLLPIKFFSTLLQNTHRRHHSIQSQSQSSNHQQQQQQQLIRDEHSLENYVKESQVVVIHFSQGILIMDTVSGRRNT